MLMGVRAEADGLRIDPILERDRHAVRVMGVLKANGQQERLTLIARF